MNRREFLKSAGMFGLGALTGCGSARSSATNKPANILLILADDMGYSDAGCYGSEIRTPVLDDLAAGGLRFTQHYSTGRCWPSRACILSGYYAQQIRRDKMNGIEFGKRPGWAKLLPEFLHDYGYKSYHSGKWHIDGTPLQAGFDRSWGSEKSGCDWDRYFRSMPWREGEYKAPIKEGQDYYSTIAITDHALACLNIHQKEFPSQPFFQYVAFYSPHFPLQALQEDIEPYRNVYTCGWDEIRTQRHKRMKNMGIVNCPLSELETDIIPDWNLSKQELLQQIGTGEVDRAVEWQTLTAEQKDFQSKKMAVHAAMITRMDAEIGRIVEHLKVTGQFENTLILFGSDNGASAEQLNRGDKNDKESQPGSAASFVCLGPGWSTAANTPFRLHKHWNHEGGISSPLIAHWPQRIKDSGQLRHDASHFIDIAPTIMEAAQAKLPEVIDGHIVPARPGISLIPAFTRGASVKHESIWWCHEKNRAIRTGDWKLSSRAHGPWELYNLKTDRSETNDLASKYPEMVESMNKRWNELADGFRNDLSDE